MVRSRDGLLAAVAVLSLVGVGCAPGRLALPTGPGIPRSDFAALFDEATAGCRGVRTITAELSLSGRANGRKLRGRVQAGLTAPAGVRFEALAPFGAPLFILAAPNEQGTLWLPRDRSVVRDAPVRDVLSALAGIEIGPADLRTLLSGCVVPEPRPQGGRQYPRGWIAIDLQAGAVAWLRQMDGKWRVGAGDHGGLLVQYGAYGPSAVETPRQLRVLSKSADDQAGVDLRITLFQVELNVPLPPNAFSLTVPEGTRPITLDELRREAPLAQ